MDSVAFSVLFSFYMSWVAQFQDFYFSFYVQLCSWVVSQEACVLLLKSPTERFLYQPVAVIPCLSPSLPLSPPLSFSKPSCFPCSFLFSWSLLVCLLNLELIGITSAVNLTEKNVGLQTWPWDFSSSRTAFYLQRFTPEILLASVSVYDGQYSGWASMVTVFSIHF